jgi:hypothetical protein
VQALSAMSVQHANVPKELWPRIVAERIVTHLVLRDSG